MKYTVLIECDEETLSDGGYLAHIPAVPGCVGRGPTQEAAAECCRESLQEYLALLLNAGALGAPHDDGPVELEVFGCTSHTFDSDYSTLMPNEAEQLVQWLEMSRDELLELVARLPPDVLDWKPTAGSWPIRQILGHVAYCDWLYVQHLADAPLDWNTPADWPEELFGRLAAARLAHRQAARVERRAARPRHDGTWRRLDPTQGRAPCAGARA